MNIIGLLKVCFLMCRRNPYEYAYLVNVKSWTISNLVEMNGWLIIFLMSSKQYFNYMYIHFFIFSWWELSLQSIIDDWKVAFGKWPWRKKEVEDYEKKVKTVMVNNSTIINHHSLNTKRGGNTIWCWKCRSWLGTG